MGVNKALLPFGGFKTLTQYQLDKFSPYFSNVYVSCKDKTEFDFKAEFIEDLKEYKESAPFIGLISLFEALECSTIFVLSVDAPFFNIEHFKKLHKHIGNYQGIIAKSPNGDQPLCAIYKKEILQTLKSLVKEKKYRFSDLFEHISLCKVCFEDEKIFTNLNTPFDYKKVY